MSAERKKEWGRRLAARGAGLYDRSRYLRALVQGFSLMIPLILVMAVALIIGGFPIPAWQSWYATDAAAPLRQGVELVGAAVQEFEALYLVIGICLSYGRLLQLRTRERAMLAVTGLACLLLLAGAGVAEEDQILEALSVHGLILAMAASLIACEVFGRVPVRERESSAALTWRVPHLLLSLGLTLVLELLLWRAGGGREAQEMFPGTLALIGRAPLAGALLSLFMVMVLWFVGIHGQYALFVIMDVYYVDLLQENIRHGAQYIINDSFLDVFVFLGGTGGMLALVIAVLLRSRDHRARQVAGFSLLPALFNVSETMIYGIPVAWNITLVLPLIAVPLVNCLIAYGATAAGLVPVVCRDVTWTAPILFSGYFATGSWSGALLQVILLVVDLLLYWPFVPLMDALGEETFRLRVQELVGLLQAQEQAVDKQRLCDLPGEQGETARALVRDLERDLRQGERLFVLYQPQKDSERRFSGMEALLRWKHASCGYIYPPLIIELAIEGDVLGDLEKFIFREAASAVRTLEERGYCACKVSANITGASAGREDFVAMVESACERAGIDPRDLWIEITEQDALDTSITALERLQELHRQGHRFLIDDFGTGHTSIDYLRIGLFDGLKLDGRITRGVTKNERDQEVIRGIAQMAHTLGMGVTAEFVEEVPQRVLLQELGCDDFQGYLYSPAVSLQEICELLDEEREKVQEA